MFINHTSRSIRLKHLNPPWNGICEPVWRKGILKYDQYGRIFNPAAGWQLSGVRHVRVLSDLNVGEIGILMGLDLPETVQEHLMYMGFVPDALVTVLRRAPAGDPTVYAIDGMEIALRRETAAKIEVRSEEEAVEPAQLSKAAL